uniref:NAD(P)H-quinone oxidoreductase subunit 3, chloroplastic n=1 Tax=Huperzia serrata f. longipetiolata TaxID=384043 RepID=A0A343R007_HUPSR|nr:NADH-plastoquinone oxidoreductase subunit 3 [Huperzia crispata]YP_011031847.1 NADH-plastoquinone oxidoreductase subunit 3 [Huperzia selago]ATV96574.1 NADH-plastoquinone oxidoreductase subunit 3 [Huperzia serrata f. longipetiolata]WRB00871.1 NADH-plastoquinone oxidoreductase subunit 3 [Huperzia sp. DW-2023a]WRB01306.1 NADH-plastoquinone oxidoreductase subunit 3 [Huperzia serrata]USH58993.1 NADH-plastoquinone oxidoreductase subunit 3 [Huperzia crispata]WRB00784.1 NADH-plastoquinone oxidoredu
MFLISKYNYFWLFLLLASLIPPVASSISSYSAPVGKGPEKFTSYESGIEPIGDAWIQFQIRYYMFASVFVISDAETVSLYPWAMCFNELGVPASAEASISVTIPIVGSVYAWRRGASEWS